MIRGQCGHEYAKRQLAHTGIGFEALDYGVLSCDDPKRRGFYRLSVLKCSAVQPAADAPETAAVGRAFFFSRAELL